MSRALRIEYPGAFYHVITRGVERRTIFAEEADNGRNPQDHERGTNPGKHTGN